MAYYSNLPSDFGGMNLGPDGRRHEAYSAQRNDYPPRNDYAPSPAYPGDHTRPVDPYRQYSDPRSDYSSPPPVPGPRPGDFGAGPSPPYSPPADKPPIPGGWSPRWDDRYQRWYYIEEATGRSQWEAPGYHPERSALSSPPIGGYAGQGTPAPSSGYGSPPPEEKRGHSGMLMGAAGGLAVGAIGGALLANAFDDDDRRDEHYAPQSYSNPPASQDPGVPLYNADGEYISGSDWESVEEAREEYLEALDDARSSSASSSDQERLEEAREEYEEEYEEAYYDD